MVHTVPTIWSDPVAHAGSSLAVTRARERACFCRVSSLGKGRESESCKDYGSRKKSVHSEKGNTLTDRHGRHFVHRHAGCFLVCMFVSALGRTAQHSRVLVMVHTRTVMPLGMEGSLGGTVGQHAGQRTYDPRVGDAGLTPLANTYNHNTY